MKDKVEVILKNNCFYDDLSKNIYVGNSIEDLGTEIDSNLITLGLADIDKNEVSVKDLSLCFNQVLMYKKHNILDSHIDKIVLFRIWHDITSDWLRYTFLSNNTMERQDYRRKSKGLEFVKDIRIVLQSFLDERNEGFYYIDKNKRHFHYYSPDDDFRKWKIYEEEINPLELKIVK